MALYGAGKYGDGLYGYGRNLEYYQEWKDTWGAQISGTVGGKYGGDGQDRKGGVAMYTHQRRNESGSYEKGMGTLCQRVPVPTNPQTATQQNWRGKFTDGIELWKTMSAAQKEIYREKASRHPTRNAHNVWMSEYLRFRWRL